MHRIDPMGELRRDLVSIQNPIRYLGGEFGQIVKDSADLTFALSFPDLYEIAMSNLAIKIIYDGLNKIPSVRCERVFAPAPDFESLLKRREIPLYTLESGIPLNEVDILGISIGYEPGITGLLAILDTGNIPLECADRGECDPIVIAGGCGITNPLPFSRFIDAFFIGEAEAGLFGLVGELAALKKGGASRSGLLERLSSHPAVWTTSKDDIREPGRTCASRAVYAEFGASSDRAVFFPVPSMRAVQDHGIVEIMRGCPNGCRFCHAGQYYRPQRMMPVSRIITDVAALVNEGGYREISLMSLSSGDYEGIDRLMGELTARFSGGKVSFQLPSLKVNGFTLPLLEKMSEVRKSGLTFAVETPVDQWQLAVNKEVYLDRIVDILLEAKRRGWSKAKFYFMIGLPVATGGLREEEEIVRFIAEVQERTRLQCTANIGTFIPKPHTPYQWSRQLSMLEAQEKLDYVYGALPKGRVKLSTHRPFNSLVEGMISRGDSRVGEVILEAYRRGCRLDAWDDWARPDIWKSVIEESTWDIEAETIRERSLDEPLPWDGVSLGPTKESLKREKRRSDERVLTERCENPCDERCGVCKGDTSVRITETVESLATNLPNPIPSQAQNPEATHRVILSFAKKNEGAFLAHLNLIEVWHKAFQRSGLPVIYTEGFNPIPRFEIAQSLSLGTSSEDEIASFLMYEDVDSETILASLRRSLPGNLLVSRAFVYHLSRKIKRESLSAVLWGSVYEYVFYESDTRNKVLVDCRMIDFLRTNPAVALEDSGLSALRITVPFTLDRPLRDLISEIIEKPIQEIIRIHKTRTVATLDEGKTCVSFFDAFQAIAVSHSQCAY